MEYEETDFTPPATNVHKVVRAKSSKKKKKKSGSVFSDLQIESYLDVVKQRLNDKALKGYRDDTKKDGSKSGSSTAGASATDRTAAPASLADEDLTPAQRRRREKGQKDAQDAMDRGETEVQTDVETGDAIVKSNPNPFKDKTDFRLKDMYGNPMTPSEPSSTAPGAVAGETKDIADTSPPMPNAQDSSEDKRNDIGKNESMFHVASVLREEDDDYSDDEISRDKDPDAAGGPYSEDDIKVTQDPRDAAPGMDPVADPPTQQAKQITTGLAYKAPAAAGTMQTMLPGGEHDAIQKQYPDLFENLLGCGGDMKGGFLTDPKDKKKAMAVMALMSQLDGKLKEDKKSRLKKILNNNKPPAIPGSEGY